MKKPLLILLFVFIIRVSYAEDPDSPFGVLEFLHWNHSWNNYKYAKEEDLKKVVSLIKEAGIGWVRFDFLWSDIEPQDNIFEFEKYDRIVDELVKNNINILGILHYSADWASSCGRWNCPPQDNQLFIDYVKKTVGRYKEKVKYWEIWNEPDSGIYWDYQYQDGLKTYCKLLKEVYLAIKEIDPLAKVLNGGLTNLSSIEKLYQNKIKEYFDILNIHIFESPLNLGSEKRLLSSVRLVYKIMRRNADENKKIWITEIGCPGVRNRRIKNWWMGKNPSEKEQARWLEVVFKELLKHQAVDKVFWAFFRDCKDHFQDGVDYFGLIRWDFSKKPAFFALKRFISSWRN
ncbi:MAG: beta-galactosidase [Candidatus Omnitrophica bacterium]|nr:beta-galactosidase [Candidatus Omnitrophota bacterium]MCM8800013.1 beta-galactosidase [Candidatus Omnitrophota bacterium]